MSLWRLILRSLAYHRKGHVGVFLGVGITCMILTGALLIGDSIRYSLRRIVEERLGQVQLAMDTNDRTVSDAIVPLLIDDLNTPVVGALGLKGVVANPERSIETNRGQILGIDQDFWKLGGCSAKFSEAGLHQAIVNRKLATKLRISVGNTLIIRVEKPGILSRDAAIIPTEDNTVAKRLVVTGILEASEFGNFNLSVNQIAPYNVFVPLKMLQDLADQKDRINQLFIGEVEGKILSPQRADEAFRRCWSLADIGLKTRELADGHQVEIQSERIFIDPPIVDTISTILPQTQMILTYFVNELRVGERTTPYSMVAAIQPVKPRRSSIQKEYPSLEMNNDEILISSWCAEDLMASPGDTLIMNYFVVDQSRRLSTRESLFRIRDVFPIDVNGIDHTLAPEIPGLSDSENCRDWNTGIPIDLSNIREKDEMYWKKYKGTPKAIITLSSGQKIWENRFGEVTAVRLPKYADTYHLVNDTLPKALNPKSIGLYFAPVRQAADDAVNQSLDFGILFIGFSFFLIVAALLLTGLLFIFSTDQRSEEQGTLSALGFTRKRIRLLYLIEGLVVSIPAGFFGMILGTVYATTILYGITTLWSSAVGDWSINFYGDIRSKSIGFVVSVVLTVVTQYFCLWTLNKKPLKNRLANLPEHERRTSCKKLSISLWVGIFCLAIALSTLGIMTLIHNQNEVIWFFVSGIFMLISLIAFCSHYLRTLSMQRGEQMPGIMKLGIRNISRQPWRSLSVIAIFACASFIIIGLESQRLDAVSNAGNRSSGTGGFALIGEATHPVYNDLNTEKGREKLGLDQPQFSSVNFVPFRILEGDDASCLNLNRAQKPRLIGVDPNSFITGNAFSFIRNEKHPKLSNPWELLRSDFGDNVIPAIADLSTITYGLGKKIGDLLIYNDEHGNTIHVRLVGALSNSVLQGNLIVDEAALTKYFPSVSGYHLFLIDVPPENIKGVYEVIEQSLQDFGLELTTTVARLNEFNQVQNTYISIFQVLGGLGIILGTFGLGVLLLRNVLERRSEFALMTSIGFSKKLIQSMLLSEHCLLLILGTLCGVCAAAIAVYPRLITVNSELPWLSLSIILGSILISGLLWIWAAAKLAMRQSLISSLRNE